MVKTGVNFMSFSNPTCHFRDTADFTICTVCTLCKVSCISEMASRIWKWHEINTYFHHHFWPRARSGLRNISMLLMYFCCCLVLLLLSRSFAVVSCFCCCLVLLYLVLLMLIWYRRSAAAAVLSPQCCRQTSLNLIKCAAINTWILLHHFYSSLSWFEYDAITGLFKLFQALLVY